MATIATITAALDDNADYDIVNDVAKARLFAVACRQFLLRAEESRKNGAGTFSHMRYNYEIIQGMLTDAIEWLRVNDTSIDNGLGGIVDANFHEFDQRGHTSLDPYNPNGTW